MTTRLWVLGAADPEMSASESLLRAAGEEVVFAAVDDPRQGVVRVNPGNAYKGVAVLGGTKDAVPAGTAVFLVECDVRTDGGGDRVVVDHHRPGDSGYGRHSSEFLAASSIGQVAAVLVRLGVRPQGWAAAEFVGLKFPRTPPVPGFAWWYGGWVLGAPAAGRHVAWTGEGVSDDERGTRAHVEYAPTAAWAVVVPEAIVMVAAADHCLAAAYAGRCRGVDPGALMEWRAQSRATFQKRDVADVLRDVEAARAALKAAPRVDVGGVSVADMRSGEVPELPEAAARDGVPFLGQPRPGPDGRKKLVLQAAPAEAIAAFLRGEGVVANLVDIYGDPARGFAGGYLK